MIEANKKLIKASFAQGVVGIQGNLVSLYQTNLTAMATQAALIAGFSFQALTNTAAFSLQDDSVAHPEVLKFFCYSLFTVSFVAALFVLSQATIVVMFGPSMALKGSSEASVKVLLGHSFINF